jgi:putative sigma-54 modulation protein
MQVIIRGHNTQVSEPLKELAVRKIEKVRRFFDRIQKLEIEFSEAHNPRVADRHEIAVTLTTKAHLLRAHAAAPDPSSAVDMVVEKLQTQVKRLKDRRTKRGERTARSPAPASLNSIGLNNPVRSAENLGEETGPRITLRRRFPVKPMTPEEAVVEMQAQGQEFLAFFNAQNSAPSVVYRRGDGSFGLVEAV